MCVFVCLSFWRVVLLLAKLPGQRHHKQRGEVDVAFGMRLSMGGWVGGFREKKLDLRHSFPFFFPFFGSPVF